MSFCCFDLYAEDNIIHKYTAGDFNFIYYGNGYSYLIPHTARAFNNSFIFEKKLFNYQPEEKITVFIHDFSDFGSGGAAAIPFNFVTAGINPFDNIYENMPSRERMQWLSSHELTHIIMCDKPGPDDSFFRTLFSGKPINDNSNPLSMIYSYLAAPRWYSPRWFHEGIAIFMETFLNGGSGRTLAGYDEMVFRTMVLDSSYFYKPVGLETEGTTIDFKVGSNSYLYGTRFLSYLATTYGKDKLFEFYIRSDSSNGFFASQFEKVYKNDLQTVWKNWIEFEHEFQKANLEKIRTNPVTKHVPVTDMILGSASRQFYDKKRNSIIAAINYPGTLAQIAEINLSSGEIRKIAPVISPRLYFVTNITYDESTGIIFITENNNNYRDLEIIDVSTGDLIKKKDFERLGDPVINKADKSLWGVRSYNGRNTLCRLVPPYNKTEEIYSVPFGYNFFDLDISPDGTKLTGTYSDLNGKQKIILFETAGLLQGMNNFKEIYEFEDNSASNFTFSDDGRYLFGTSYITGVSNIFRINIETHEAEILTNTERGYFRPIQLSPDTMLAYSYTAKGLLPVKIKIDTTTAEATSFLGMEVLKRNPELRNWVLPPISSVKADSLNISSEEYSPLKEMGLVYLIPIAEGYKDFPSYGIKAKFLDKMFLSNLDLNLSYSYSELLPEKERLHFMLKYNYWFWEFSASWNKADFYDLFGPTKRSREGGMFALKYLFTFFPNRKPETFNMDIHTLYYFDLKTLPEYQNVKFSADRLTEVKMNLDYNVYRKSLGAIEDESGYGLKFHLTDEYTGNSNFFKIFASAEFGQLLPIRNSSVWLRLFGGKSFGDETNPFNYFYFGGFGNNYLDNNSVQRYRELLSFAGTQINSTPANSFTKATLEWNLPPVRFLNFGFLPAYITYGRLSLFSTLLNNDLEKFDKQTVLINCGAQLDFELSMFYLLKTYLSFGYAAAFRNGNEPSDEFMISLKF